jgi:spermidine synthase
MPILDLSKEKESGHVLEDYVSNTGTHVEMIHCSNLGITCYMDGVIQSCEMDEKVYHEALVSTVMKKSNQYEDVLILGGGEGAVAREVLLYQHVKHVDMVDWDQQVVTMFRQRYPQWGKEAWTDERLHLSYENVMDRFGRGFSKSKYDVIIVDLFDLSNEMIDKYQKFMAFLQPMLKDNGSMVMYAGIYDTPATKEWVEWCTQDRKILPEYNCYVYHKSIVSFDGEATFISWLPRQ